jgi:hypothetical protein
MNTLMRALGDRKACWLDLEERLTERRRDLEAAYFDVGYEQGRVAGREEALRTLRHGASSKETVLARRIRAALDAPGAQSETVALLLALAWSLALPFEANR